MSRRVELDFRSAAQELIPDGSTLLAAVSGGGDSVALLHLLHRFAANRGIRITIGHLDHGLRRGSREDRRFVERLGDRLGLQCVSRRREVAELRRKGESPEESARRVRRQFLLEARKEAGADRIVTGHTLDDQAETVLMRLVRGAGATALTGMAAAGPGPFVRPLLSIERDALRAYLAHRALEFREDPTNRDLRFDRNRVRRLVLPILQEVLNPRAARQLVRAASLLREDARYLDELGARALERWSKVDDRGRCVLQARELAAAPVPIAKRVLRLALQQAGADPRRLASRHVLALLDLSTGAGGRELHLPGRLLARRLGSRIILGEDPDR